MDPSRAEPSPRRRPRNWHSATEQRRLFWLILPVMLIAAWAERTWWSPTSPPRPAPIDTILSRGPLTKTIEDGVTIEGEVDDGVPAGEPVEPRSAATGDITGTPEAREILADATDLALVRDDTVFRSADRRAWFAIWERLQGEAAAGAEPRGREVTFAQLFSQPRSFRGRRVRLAGTIRRLQEVAAPENPLGIASYWQAWLEPAGGPATPVVVYFLHLPPGTPSGMRVEIPVIVDGVFFKRWAYEASDAIRLAPLLMATEPHAPPRITSGRGQSPLVAWALGSSAALVATTWLAPRLAAGPRHRKRCHPARIDADLDAVTVVDPREALGRLATLDVGAGDGEADR